MRPTLPLGLAADHVDPGDRAVNGRIIVSQLAARGWSRSSLSMANDHGLLPKADPEQLDDEMRRRLEVWFDKAYEDDNLFLTLAREPEVLRQFLDWVGFIYTDRSSLDPKLVELCRIRLAVRNQCVH
ncbi:MAG: hypothetical protein ACR2QO_22590 [Acidimicrobiales bacterium]